MPRSDTLAHVMRKCKESSSAGEAFIRSVQAAPEPMCVLATNQQLSDLQSTGPLSPTRLGIRSQDLGLPNEYSLGHCGL